MPAGKSLKTAVVWLNLSDLTNTSPESELHREVLQLPSVAVSPQFGLKTGCVVAPVHAKESISMRSQHAQAPSSQFCCLFT